MTKTIQFYNKNYITLLDQYDNARMYEPYQFFDKYITKDNIVLDLGFGSGRDLNYIKNITNDIYGIDGSIKFINNLKRDKFYENRISLSLLPKINTSFFKINTFDIIISIAVFMHLTKDKIIKTIKNIKNKLNSNARVIISYSTKSRDNDERDFYKISKDEMTYLFNNENFKEVEFIINNDSLNRKIEWVTQVYEL